MFAAYGWLAGILVSVAGPILSRVLIGLGIGFVSYTGVDLIQTQVYDLFMSNAGALPASASQWLGILKVGTCLNILLSAMAIRAALAGVNSGAIKKMTIK